MIIMNENVDLRVVDYVLSTCIAQSTQRVKHGVLLSDFMIVNIEPSGASPGFGRGGPRNVFFFRFGNLCHAHC